jgi:hypothetical protein
MRRALQWAVILLLALVASGQDCRDCKPEFGVSFNEMKDSVRRTMTTRMHTSWEEKQFARFGDVVAVAVLQTVDDSEMAEPDKAKDVLAILWAAFGCPQHCVKNVDDRRPRVTLLLLEHLRQISGGKIDADIDRTKKLILEQTRKVD